MKKLFTYIFIILLFPSCIKTDNSYVKTLIKPYVDIHHPEPNMEIKRTDFFDISATAYSFHGSVYSVEVFIDGDKLGEFYNNEIDLEYRIIEIGDHILSFIVQDGYGKSDPIELPITIVDGDVPDAYVWLSGQDTYVNDSLLIEFSSHSPNGEIINSKFYLNDELVFENDSMIESLLIAPVPAGDYKLRFEVIDELDASATAEKTITVLPNIPPSLSISRIDDGDIYYFGRRVDMLVSGSDKNGFVTRTKVQINDTIWETDESYWSRVYERILPADYHLRAVNFDDDGDSTVKEIGFKVLPTISYSGAIVDLSLTLDDDVLIGLEKNSDQLVKVNLETKNYQTFELPYHFARKMDYDQEKDIAYAVYSGPLKIVKYELKDNSSSTHYFSEEEWLRDFLIDSENDRAYLATNEKIYILDLVDFSVINYYEIEYIDQLAFSKRDQVIYFAGVDERNEVEVKVGKFRIENDEFFLQKVVGGFGQSLKDLDLHPSEDYLLVCSDSYQGSANSLILIDINDLQTFGSSFEMGNSPNQFCFSNTGDRMIAYNKNADPYSRIIIKDFNTYSEIDKLTTYKYDRDCLSIITNRAGTKVVAFIEGYSNPGHFYVYNIM